MRTVLSVLFFIVCVYIGYAKSTAIKQEITAAEAAIKDIAQLGMLMDYRLMPIGELAASLREPGLTQLWEALSTGLAGGTPLDRAWSEAVKLDSSRGGPGLSKDLQGILLDFGTSLGSSDLESQKKNIDCALVCLNRYADEQRDKLRHKGRVYRTLGVLGGMAAAILVW